MDGFEKVRNRKRMNKQNPNPKGKKKLHLSHYYNALRKLMDNEKEVETKGTRVLRENAKGRTERNLNTQKLHNR